MKKLILLLIAFCLLGYVPLYAFPPQPKVSGGAPIGAHYLVDLADGTLTAEVVVSANGKSLITTDYAGMKTLTGWYTATGDLDADLQTYAGITPSADVQSVLGCADEAAILTFLDLEPGTDFYSIAAADAAFEAELNNSAGLAAALDDETGYSAGALAMFNISPIIVTSLTMGSAVLSEAELEILDGATLSTTQINYLASATGTTGTNTTNLVYSESPTFTGTAIFATINVGTLVMDASATPQWVFRDSGNPGTDKEIAKIYANFLSGADGAEDGGLYFQAMLAGSEVTFLGWDSDTITLTLGNTYIFDASSGNLTLPTVAGDLTLTSGKIGIDTTQAQLGFHDGTREIAIPSIQVIQAAFDPGSWYDSDAEVWLLDLFADRFPDGIVITKWYVDANVADPDVEMDMNLMWCDAVGGAAFPGASPTSIDVMDTTTGNSSETVNTNMAANGVVAAGKSLYLLFDADPEGTCTQLSVKIYYYIPES